MVEPVKMIIIKKVAMELNKEVAYMHPGVVNDTRLSFCVPLFVSRPSACLTLENRTVLLHCRQKYVTPTMFLDWWQMDGDASKQLSMNIAWGEAAFDSARMHGMSYAHPVRSMPPRSTV